MKLAPLKKGSLSTPPSIIKLLGPSFILLGLGLGSGELILWPYLSANFGLGIIWGALLGISLQFFLNMEIARYTLVTGESVFVGLTRKLGRISPIWFIFSTLTPWMWPGIIASAATLLAALLGIPYTPILPIVLLLLVGVILTLGPVIYKTQEALQKIVILVGVPFIFVLAFRFATPPDWQALFAGLTGHGDGYRFFPAGLPIATFLAAFAYAGAGGNLNLTQSLYIKEKGYGMGKYAGRITSVLTGRKEKLTLEGTTFELTPQNISRFNVWWRLINIEHGLVFWLTGALTMFLLSLLAYTTVSGMPDTPQGISFVVAQGRVIGNTIGNVFGVLFLIVATVMLFFTQFSVFGSTSRIMSENLILTAPRIFSVNASSRYFYVFLWLQIMIGILIFSLGFKEPLTLVILGAVLNAFSMFIYSGLILWLNRTNLAKALRPGILRSGALALAFLFYGGFSIFTIITQLQKIW